MIELEFLCETIEDVNRVPFFRFHAFSIKNTRPRIGKTFEKAFLFYSKISYPIFVSICLRLLGKEVWRRGGKVRNVLSERKKKKIWRNLIPFESKREIQLAKPEIRWCPLRSKDCWPYSRHDRVSSFNEMHALPACRQATSATWSRGYLVGTRSNVTFFRTELFAKLRWSNVFDYFFKKLPLCSIRKANNISDMRLYIFIVVDTSQRGARLGHDHPRLSFPLLRRSRFIVSCR